MKNILIYTIGIIIVIGIIFFQYKNNQNIKRQLENFEQIQSDNNAKILRLTKSEFKRSDSLLKHKLDSLNIKLKRVNKIITHNYKYSYDTTIRLITVPNSQIKRFEYKPDNCIFVNGFVDTFADTLIFTTFDIDIESETFYFWERSKKFWFIKYGKKNQFAKTINNCSGETETTEINIVKKY